MRWVILGATAVAAFGIGALSNARISPLDAADVVNCHHVGMFRSVQTIADTPASGDITMEQYAAIMTALVKSHTAPCVQSPPVALPGGIADAVVVCHFLVKPPAQDDGKPHT